jgi:phage terminase small subunit
VSNKLTAKQEAFCREYLIDLNATQAAIRAGYSENTARQVGSENLSKPYISEFISSLKVDRSERVQLDADWVLKASKQLFDRCMTEEDFSSSGAAKSIELIGKHVTVKAFEQIQQGNDSSLADSVNKLIDKLPS